MSRSGRLTALAVALFATAWGGPTLTSGYEGPYDEGNTLCAAWRALGGEAPYRDFWLLHPPGTTWLLAAAFRVFGVTLGVERGVKVAVLVVSAILVFLLARLAARPRWAAAAAFLFVVLPTQTLSLRSRDTGLVLVLAALLAAGAGPRSLRRRSLVAGLLAGFTVWFKQDFALVAVAATAIPLAWDAGREAPPEGRRRAAFREALLPFASGVVVGPALLVATLGARGILGEFFGDVIRFPAVSFRAVRGISLAFRIGQVRELFAPWADVAGASDALAVPALFFLAFVAGLAALLSGGRGAVRQGGSAVRTPLAAGLSALLLLVAPYERADLEHLGPALGLALVALACLAGPRDEAAAFVGRTGAAAAALAAVALFAFVAPRPSRRAALPPDLVEAARFVSAHSKPTEVVFVGNARHDRLAYGAPLLYFLAGRKGATRYDNLHPGVATTRPVQEEIVRDLETRRVRVLALWRGERLEEPNESAVSSGVTVLDAWIAAHAREEARFGDFRVLRVERPGPATPVR